MLEYAVAYLPRPAQEVVERVRTSPLAYRLAKGTFWSFVGSAVAKGLVFAAAILIARILGKSTFGEFGIVQSTVGMFGIFGGFGLGITASKHVAEFRQGDTARAARIIALSEVLSFVFGFAAGAVLFFLAPFLAGRVLAAPQLVDPLRLGALLMLVSAMNGAQVGALSGFEAFGAIARTNLWSGIASFPLCVIGAYYWQVSGAVLGLTLGMGISWLLNHLALRRETVKARVPFRLSGFWSERQVLWSYSLPAFLSGSLSAPALWACNAILVNQHDGYSQMGVLNATNQCRNILMYSVTVITPVLLPILASQLNESSEHFNDILSKAHKTLLIAVLPLATLMVLLSSPIMSLYGKSFSSGRDVLIYILGATAISCIGFPAGTALEARGKMWVCATLNGTWAVVLVFTSFLLRHQGAEGIALAMLAAYVIQTTWGYLYQRTLLPKGMLFRTFCCMLLVVGIMCTATAL